MTQSQPLSANTVVPETIELMHSLSRITVIYDRVLRDAREEFALSARAFHMLALIAAGKRFPSDLAEWLGVARSVVSFELEKLVEAQLLRREADPADGRRVRLAMTAKGVKVNERVAGAVLAELEARLERLPPPTRQQFIRDFAALAG